jgi:hypothetical protein
MKKKLLIGMLALPLAFAVNVNAARVTSDYVTYDYNFNVSKIEHVNNGHTKQYYYLRGMNASEVPAIGASSGVHYYYYFGPKNVDVPINCGDSGCYFYRDKMNAMNKYVNEGSGTLSERLNNINTQSFVDSLEIGPAYSNTSALEVARCSDLEKENNDIYINTTSGYWFYNNNFNNFYIIKSVEENGKNKLFISKAYEVEKSPAPIYKRFQYLITSKHHKTIQGNIDTDSSIFSNNPYTNTGLNFTVKIGKITDKSYLSDIANNKANAYENFKNYAKNAEGNTYTFNYYEAQGYHFDTANLELDPNYYYFVYITHDDGGVSIEDYSDIMISRVSTDSDGVGVTLAAFEDLGEFATPETGESTPTTKPKNPKTGVEDLVYLVPVVLFGGLGVVALTRKKTSFR